MPEIAARFQVSALKASGKSARYWPAPGRRSRVDHAAAAVAVARVVQQVQVLAAELQVVTAGRVVGQREVVADRVHVLIAIARQVVVAAESRSR